MQKLPQNLSTLTLEILREAVKTRDERMSPLFRRWPALNSREIDELKALYGERVRVAKHLGTRGRARVLRAGLGDEAKAPRP
jgi:hypothetical protein